ncbi:MAG: DUF2793 domain-containing protein [Proteobacteria bacterium]|nr:DUF2793 domain-containing protein [Pseudomonadota bacterium]
MTDTPNLGMPYIDGSQAQKHVTHNEALRILDAAIQIGVRDLTRTAPPSSPVEGERHVVASGGTGAWAAQDKAIATWQDGAWAFLVPKTGWCVWSVADDIMFVFDGTVWRDFRSLPEALDNALRVGINTAASSPNLLSVKSNAALFAAINAADGGTGDARLQVSKEAAANTASVFFSDNFSGRAEFGLVGSDAFKLKVSPDGSVWSDAFNIDQNSGNLTLPRGLALTGLIAPAQITANQNDYNPAGIATASVLQINADAARSISGLAGGTEGRCVTIINVGSQPVTLLDESASSSASNRLTLGGNLTISAKQAAILRYDGTAARWQAIAGGTGGGDSGSGVVSPPLGRLTLQSGVPVMAASQSGATMLYYTPYGGNQIPIYDGTNMVRTAFSELSQGTTDTTKSPAAVAASKIYDLFVWNDGGTLRLSRGPAWTNATTRGYSLAAFNGILVNASSITNGPAAERGTWVGTIASNASSTIDYIFGTSGTGGVAGRLMVWNSYNRVNVGTTVVDTTSYTDSSNTIKQFHSGGSGMQVELLLGAQTDAIRWGVATELALIGVNGTFAIVGVGLDILTAFSAQRARLSNPTATTFAAILSQSGVWTPSIGTHTVAMLQQSDGSNANQFNNTGAASLSVSLCL